MAERIQTGDEDIWDYIAKEETHIYQIPGMNGGYYLPVGVFKRVISKQMSNIAFRRLDDGTFALCTLRKCYVKQMKVHKVITVEEFRWQLQKIDLFLKKLNVVKREKMESVA